MNLLILRSVSLIPLLKAAVVPVVLAAALLGAPPAQATTASRYGGCMGQAPTRILAGTPANYLSLLPGLVPGDLLRLAPGTYPSGLPLNGTTGEPGRCIVIQGPERGPRPVFTGRDCCNTVSLRNVAYLVIRNLELDGQGRQGDGVKAEGDADFAHHVTLENLYIHGHGAGQQIVGINTKCEAWNWVIRRNVIEGAGTGLYLGDSNGEAEFVHGLIEYNLVVDTLGYNLQIKHQVNRSTELGIPASGRTLVRHNVFSKAAGAATGPDARPNVLVGHWPLSGPGSDDDYLVYGNFFYQNATAVEPLFQGEGNVSLYDNVLINDFGPGILIRSHNHLPRRVKLFQNTVVAATTGIRVRDGEAGFVQQVVGNAAFGAPALNLTGAVAADNVGQAYADAAAFLVRPGGAVSGGGNPLDLRPLAGALTGPAIDLTPLDPFPDGDRDFEGNRRAGTRRGAFEADGSVPPAWPLALERRVFFAEGFEGGDLLRWTFREP